jgi:hypothetical protein
LHKCKMKMQMCKIILHTSTFNVEVCNAARDKCKMVLQMYKMELYKYNMKMYKCLIVS